MRIEAIEASQQGVNQSPASGDLKRYNSEDHYDRWATNQISGKLIPAIDDTTKTIEPPDMNKSTYEDFES